MQPSQNPERRPVFRQKKSGLTLSDGWMPTGPIKPDEFFEIYESYNMIYLLRSVKKYSENEIINFSLYDSDWSIWIQTYWLAKEAALFTWRQWASLTRKPTQNIPHYYNGISDQVLGQLH